MKQQNFEISSQKSASTQRVYPSSYKIEQNKNENQFLRKRSVDSPKKKKEKKNL